MTKQNSAASQVAQLMEMVNALKAEIAELKEKPKVKKASKRGQPREGVKYVLLSIPTKNIQPQGITVAKILSMAADPANISESEAMELMEKYKNLFNTQQEAWRIFQYYRPRLIEMNCLLMPSK